MASSGLARPYTIKTRVTPLDKNVAISRFFTIKGKEPDDLLISEEGITISLWDEGERRDTLKIFTVDGSFPMSITPEFVIAATSRFGNITAPDGSVRQFVNGNTHLLFESHEAHQLTVISESGLENRWNIVVRHAPLVSGSDGISAPELLEGSDINPRTVSATLSGNAPFVVDEIFIDNETENILLALKKAEGNIAFPVNIQLQFTILDGVQVLEWKRTEAITFNGWDDVKTFYLLDTEDCVSRQWKVGLKEWKASGNNVLSFGYDYEATEVRTSALSQTRSPAIVLDKSKVTIQPNTGDIYISMTAVNNVGALVTTYNVWRLTLKDLDITVSDGATIEPSTPSFVWTGNNSWMTSISFKVIAQDGAEKIWRVNIRDMRNYVFSGSCELFGLTIVRHTPNYAVFDAFTPVTLDSENRTITLKLTEDDGVYPLKVWTQCDISPFAQVTSQNGGADPLIFENENSQQTLTITAENGTTSSDWIVKLQPPPREAQANVETFRVTSISQGAQLAQVVRNEEKGVIRLMLNAATTFPLDVTYVMTVSKNATASIPLRGTLTIHSYQEARTFTVTARDGSTRNWNVRLVYEPQLVNWNLDEWLNPDPVGWSTANQASSNTSSVTGNPGLAAQMRTNSTLNIISSGSLFLGDFNRYNRPITAGLSDPISLTFFGIPFKTSGKILGMQFDAIYVPGKEFISGTDRELGSCTIELLKPKPGMENAEFVYHGADATGKFHNENMANPVAHAKAELGNTPGIAWNGSDITIVSNNKWTTVQVLFNYPDGKMPDFTHLHIVFASSAQGDAFKGVSGSTLKIDNVRILYEEE